MILNSGCWKKVEKKKFSTGPLERVWKELSKCSTNEGKGSHQGTWDDFCEEKNTCLSNLLPLEKARRSFLFIIVEDVRLGCDEL